MKLTSLNLLLQCNNEINKYKSKLIITMLESLRKKFMNSIRKRHQNATSWSFIPSRVQANINKAYKQGKYIDVLLAGEEEFKVLDENRVMAINLKMPYCVCCAWQISGLPCKNVGACINNKLILLHIFTQAWT